MSTFGGRLLRGLIGAALFGGLGWVAGRLTVGMILSRQFDAGQQQQIERVLPYFYVIAGFVTGAGFDTRWLKSSAMRPICWGAVFGLLMVMLPVRLILWLYPELEFRHLTIFGRSIWFDVERIGLISAPGALFLGGFLGWFCYRQFSHRQKVRLEESGTD